MGDRDELPYIVIERHTTSVAPFFWGALLGAAAALLIAPRTGAETQQEIRARMRSLRNEAEDRVEDARGSLLHVVDRTRSRVTDRIDAVRDAVQSRTSQARDAFDTGRRAARDARSELEDRLHDAKRAARGEAHLVDDAAADIEIVVTDVIIEEPTRPDVG